MIFILNFRSRLELSVPYRTASWFLSSVLLPNLVLIRPPIYPEPTSMPFSRTKSAWPGLTGNAYALISDLFWGARYLKPVLLSHRYAPWRLAKLNGAPIGVK